MKKIKKKKGNETLILFLSVAMAYLRATFLRVHLYFKTSFLVSQKEEQDSKTRLSIRGRQEFLNEVD